MINTEEYSLLKLTAIVIAGSALFACASAPPAPPTELRTETELSIRAAEQAEAGGEAPVELRAAKDQLAAAERSIRDEEYDIATLHLEKALANADYATMKSRSEKMQQAAEEVEETIEMLRKELESDQSSKVPSQPEDLP